MGLCGRHPPSAERFVCFGTCSYSIRAMVSGEIETGVVPSGMLLGVYF